MHPGSMAAQVSILKPVLRPPGSTPKIPAPVLRGPPINVSALRGPIPRVPVLPPKPSDAMSWLRSCTVDELAQLPRLILQETDRRFQEMFKQRVGQLVAGQHIWIDCASEPSFAVPSPIVRMEFMLAVELESGIVVDTSDTGLSAYLASPNALAGINRACRAGRLKLATDVLIAIYYYPAESPGFVYDPETGTIYMWSGVPTGAPLMAIDG